MRLRAKHTVNVHLTEFMQLERNLNYMIV